jgi:hypothetical protein
VTTCSLADTFEHFECETYPHIQRLSALGNVEIMLYGRGVVASRSRGERERGMCHLTMLSLAPGLQLRSANRTLDNETKTRKSKQSFRHLPGGNKDMVSISEPRTEPRSS